MVEASRFVHLPASVALANTPYSVKVPCLTKFVVQSNRKRYACIFEVEAGRFDQLLAGIKKATRDYRGLLNKFNLYSYSTTTFLTSGAALPS